MTFIYQHAEPLLMRRSDHESENIWKSKFDLPADASSRHPGSQLIQTNLRHSGSLFFLFVVIRSRETSQRCGGHELVPENSRYLEVEPIRRDPVLSRRLWQLHIPNLEGQLAKAFNRALETQSYACAGGDVVNTAIRRRHLVRDSRLCVPPPVSTGAKPISYHRLSFFVSLSTYTPWHICFAMLSVLHPFCHILVKAYCYCRCCCC